MTEKVAIFLDVENLSGWLKSGGGEQLLAHANKLGQVAVRKAYGDFSVPSVSLRQAELNLLGFEFVHVYHSVKGKNSADIQITVDAMEYFARMPEVGWFVLATGDSDFSPLFRKLRELGKSVVGIGPCSALSKAVKKSCTQFIYTEKQSIGKQPTEKQTQVNTAEMSKARQRKHAIKLLKQVLDKLPDGANLSQVKNDMLIANSAFDEKALGFSSFKKFLQSAPEIGLLYQQKNVWHIKAVNITATKNSRKTTPSK